MKEQTFQPHLGISGWALRSNLPASISTANQKPQFLNEPCSLLPHGNL